MIDVWAVWCAPCKIMEETTYRNPTLIRSSEYFVPVKVNADINQPFIERHRIDAYPTLLFLDQEGREITRLEGLTTAPELIETQAMIREGYESYLASIELAADTESLEATAAYLTRVGNPAGAADLLRKSLKKLPAGAAGGRDIVTLLLAEARLAAGESRNAAKLFSRLADEAALPEERARALAGLARAERARGRDAQARAALQRLEESYPQLAAD